MIAMEATLICPEPQEPLSDGRQFHIVMIYEDAHVGSRAQRFADKLLGEIRADCECVSDLWRFDVLALSEVRNAAVRAATAADLVIVSASGERDLPSAVADWLELWAWMIDGTRPALVALFQDSEGKCVRRIQTRLRAIAAKKDLEFFAQTTAEGCVAELADGRTAR